MKTTQTLKRFYSGITRDLKVILARSSIANFAVNLNPYNSIFIVALGATGTQPGLLTSLSLGLTAVTSILTGWLSDRLDRKKMFLVAAFNALAVPASVLGGWLWNSVSRLAPFVFMALVDGLIRMPIIYLYVPDSKSLDQGPGQTWPASSFHPPKTLSRPSPLR